MKPSKRNPLFNRISRGTSLAAAIVLSLGAALTARSQTLYWDTNGDTPGLGGGGGNWDTGTNWSTSLDGEIPTVGWTDNNIARFQTGGDYTVTIGGVISLPELRIAAPNLQTISGGEIAISGGSLTLHTAGSPSAGGNTKTLSSLISGTGNLNVNAHGDTSDTGGGSNTHLVISGTNTFAGTVNLNSGLFQFSSNANFGDAANTLNFNGGGILLTAGSLSLPRNFTVNAAGVVRTYGGTTITHTGTITGGASGNLRKTDGGTLVLDGDGAAYSGTLTVGAGNLQLNQTDWANTAIVQTDNANVLRLNAAGTTTIKSLVSDRDIIVPFGSRLNIANGTYTTVGAGTGFNGFLAQGTTPGSAAATGEITSSSGTLTITNGVIAEPRVLTGTDNRIRLKIVDSDGSTALAVVKNNDNQLVFDMVNTYTGGTTINGGRIHADNLSAFGTGTVTVNDFGQAWLTLAGTYTNDFVINGLGVPEVAGRLGAIRFANTTLSGNVHVATDARMVAWSSTATLTGALTGSAALDLNLAGGPGTINFTGNTSGYTGTMALNAGTLNVGALGGGLSVLGGTANVAGAVAGTTSVSAGGTLNLNAGGQTGTIDLPAGLTRTINVNAGATVAGDILTDAELPNAAVVNIGGAVTGSVLIDDNSALGLRGGTIGGNLTSGYNETSNIAWNHTAPVSVTGNVTVLGTQTVTLLNNPTPGSSATVLNFGGSLIGNITQFTLANPTAYRSVAFTNTGSAITVSTGSGTRTWVGGDATNPTFWDSVTQNWNEGDKLYFNGDAVVFNDDAVGTTVAMQGTVLPYSISLANATKALTIGGPGFISGATGVTKSGAGTVTLGGGDGQNFTGPIAVNAGTLRMGSRDAFGLTSGITVANGAVVDINGQAPGSVATGGYTYNIIGDGTGLGAIVNTGGDAASNAGVKTLNLTGNASIGGTGRFDIGFANTAGYGTINGNNFTLTKKGTNQVAFRGPATGSPINIVVEGGAIWAENNGTAFGGTTGSVTVKNGARAGSYGALTVNTPVTIESGGTLHNQGGGAGTWTETLTFQSGSTIESGTEIVVSGTANQTGTVAKTGGAQLTITGTWALGAGTLNHNAGTIQVGNVGATGAFTGNGTVNVAAGLLFRNRLSGANNTIAANFTFASATSELRQHSGQEADTLTLTGTIGNNTANGILRTTFGRITLGAGANATVNTVSMQGASATRSVINVATGASLTTTYFNIGDGGGNSGVLNVTGGTVTVPAGGTGIRIGHWNNNNGTLGSQINVTAGLFDGSAANVVTNVGWDGYGTMSVGGGANPATFKTWRLQMDANGDSTGYNATATVLANGLLEIGAGGTASPSTNDYVILNSGRMIATGNANWGARIDVAGDSEIGAATGAEATQTGTLTGAGNLTKIGAGAFRFGTFGTWTGNLTVAEGTLVGSGTIPGNTTVAAGGTLSPGAAFAPGSVATATLGGTTAAISGRTSFDLNATDVTPGGTTNDLVVVPMGTGITFNAGAVVRPSFYGGTLASGNRYRLFQVEGTRTGLPAVDPEIANSVRFTLSVLPGVEYPTDVDLLVSGSAGNLVWAGDGTGNAWDLNSSQNWTLDASPAKFLNYDSVSFTDAGDATVPITLTGTLLPNSVTVDSSKNYTWQGTGTISGSTGLAKAGSGALTILNSNALNGVIDIAGGSVAIGNGGTSGSIATAGGNISIAADASLAFNRSDAVTLTRVITGDGSLVKNGTGTLTFNTGGNTVLPTNVTVNQGTLQVSSGSFFTGSRLQGGGTLTVNSGATLLLQGAAHALGGTNAGVGGLHIVLNGGTMTANNEQYIQTMTLNGAVVNGTNETRALSGTVTAFNVTGTTASTHAARLSLGLGNAVWNVDDVTTGTDATISGQITGGNGIVKNGEGTLALTGSTSFTGTLTLNAGVVAIGGTGSKALGNPLAGAGTLRNDATGMLTVTATSPAFAGTLDSNGRSLNIGQSFGGTGSVIRLAGTPLNSGVGVLNFGAIAGDQTSEVPVTTTTISGDFSSLHSASGNVVPGTTTHVFRGRIYLQGGVQYSFAKNFDDGMWVKVADTVVINDDTWNAVVAGSYTPQTTGWYDVDVRAYQGGGGAGPQGDWLTAGIGLGIRQGTPTLVPGDYQPFGHGAAGVLLAADDAADTIASGILLAGGTSSSINTPIADLTVSGAITSAANEGIVKTGAMTLTLAGVNTYTGNTNVSEGALVLASGGQIRFRPTTNGVSNKVTGLGAATFSGAFNIDLGSAAIAVGNSWPLVDVASPTYTASFSVVGFDDPEDDGVWVRSESGNQWSFSETTGVLTLTAVTGGYDNWALQIGDANQRGRGDDPDGDSLTNLQEFLFGTNPTVNTGSLTTSEVSGNTLILRWLQRESGAAYTLKESVTLAAGSWATSPLVPALDSQTGVPADYDRYRVVIPLGAVPTKFFRVEGVEN